ncbi:MAG: type II toxin-antitoxin system Phd/YefM family antitoxin [Chloroflexi bacterium]|nr:type II toxin-antitoxin system Phd/YefM family antitoxin [Chloroflexota bacterium]
MTRIVTSTQLKQKTGEILAYAIENKEEVIIQRYAVPKAVIVDYDAYQRMREAQKELDFRRIREIAETVSARAAHLTDDELDEMILTTIEEVRRDLLFERLRRAAEQVSARAAHLSEEERAELVSDAIAETGTERRAS